MLSEQDKADGWRAYWVTRTCGHSEQIEVFAPDHAKAVAHAGKQQCTVCDPSVCKRYRVEGGNKHAVQ